MYVKQCTASAVSQRVLTGLLLEWLLAAFLPGALLLLGPLLPQTPPALKGGFPPPPRTSFAGRDEVTLPSSTHLWLAFCLRSLTTLESMLAAVFLSLMSDCSPF